MLMREPRRPAATCDQLFVRLRCRRAALAAGAPPGWQPPGNPWRAWRHELTWVYDRLPPALARQLETVFVAAEIHQLLLALRFLAAGDRSAVFQCCRESLLAEPLQELLRQAPDLVSALRQLDELPPRETLVPLRLAAIYRDQGPGGVEQALLGWGLQHGRQRGHSEPVRGYFRYLIDMRNLLGIDRHLRWRLAQAPSWLAGGSLGRGRLQQLWAQHRPEPLQAHVARLAGPGAVPAGDLETQLWDGLGRQLRGVGRDPLSGALVLDYLVRWQLFLRRQAATAS